MATNKYSVGAEIEAYCTKCKLDRLHAIEALKSDGNINRVICRTCQGSHLYRRPKSAAAQSGAARRRRAGAVTVTEAELKNAKPYAMDRVFKVGDIIDHPTFGPGKVLEVRPGGRIDVGFATGGKRLVCGIG
jgi:hypothetical protein